MNPFERLGKPAIDNPRGEAVEGAFTCQECYNVVNDARYLEEVEMLTWKCNNGHVNRIEMKF